MRARTTGLTAVLAVLMAAGVSVADPPEIVAAEARAASDGWTFSVTLSHPDTGWDHYADAWAVMAPDGRELGLRVLLHPHETEQPFSRALARVAVPDAIDTVAIRARCSVDGWADARFDVRLER